MICFKEFLMQQLLSEAITIPKNDNDPIEVALYDKLPKGYVHGDRIIRWYRNTKKAGESNDNLKRVFVVNLTNIIDLMKTYDSLIETWKRNKMTGKKLEIQTTNKTLQFDPITDIDKIRKFEGFKALVDKLYQTLSDKTTITSTSQKYAITDEDKKNIVLLNCIENVFCWRTETYESTNKFVYQLWQNAETLGRGDVYGDPSKQTPYCTHSKQHWDNYSEDYTKYYQFWYLKNVNQISAIGDLNNPQVAEAFNSLQGQGSNILIAMNDSGDDFLNKYDEEIENYDELDYGNEVQKLELYRQFPELKTESVESIIYNFMKGKTDGFLNFAHNHNIKKLIKYATKIVIPDNITAIDNHVFERCNNLVEVMIPSSVKSIGAYAFCSCKNLTNVKIENGLTKIKWCAFSDCDNLKDIFLPDSIKTLEYGIFGLCEKLEHVHIPNNVNRISDNMFKGCKNLKSIVIPDSVKQIGDEVFDCCYNLVDVKLSKNLNAIGSYAFAGCVSLNMLIIPDSVQHIGSNAFFNCDNLTDIKLSRNLDYISEKMFYKCASLTKVEIPDGIQSICDGAFEECRKLEQFIIPASVEAIGKYAFFACNGPKNIIVPDSTVYIGKDAFYNIKNLEILSIPSNVRFHSRITGDDVKIIKRLYINR